MANSDEADINIFSSSPKARPKPLSPSIKPLDSLPQLDLEIDSLYYKMDHPKRGLAIIFNHFSFDDKKLPDRNGTDVDSDALEKTLLSLNFTVLPYRNLKLAEICDVITKVQRMDHSESDCLLIAVLSHGEMNKINAKDHEYEPELLWMPFVGSNCPSLAGKPKLFFIQACRGEDTDEGVKVQTRVSISRVEADSASFKPPPRPVHVIPKMADLLIMYATFEGHVSFRNPTMGSWFVENLCRELRHKILVYDLQTILTIVNQKVATLYQSNCPTNVDFDQKKQVGVIVSTLIRLIKFSCSPSQR